GLNGTFGITNVPELFVLVDRSKPLTGFLISTVALGITAPVGSITMPPINVELEPDCASVLKLSPALRTSMDAARNRLMSTRFLRTPVILHNTPQCRCEL